MKVVESVDSTVEEVALYTASDSNPYFGYVIAGFFFFNCVNFVTRAFTPAKLRYYAVILTLILILAFSSSDNLTLGFSRKWL